MKYGILKSIMLLLLISAFSIHSKAQYYDGTEGLTSNELKVKLHQIIKGHEKFSYAAVKDILKDADEDPDKSGNVILLYSGFSLGKDDFASNNEPDFWNREHVWAKSHGFPDEPDTAYTDVHHLRPCDATVNSSRGNKDFNNVEHTAENEQGEAPDTYTNSDFWEPRDAVKGDVARMMFYMDTRYNSDFFDLKLVDRESFSGDPELGILYTLIKWHEQDPVSQSELDRNEVIFGYQKNRNPFVDHPEWVSEIWGNTTNPFMVLNVLSFNADFGVVSSGDNLTQVYKVNTYNLQADVTVTVDAPFFLSLDESNWDSSLTIAFDSNSSEEKTDVYVKYEPTATGSISTGNITHTTQGENLILLEVTGEEGNVALLSIAEARTKSNGESVYVTGVVIDAGTNSSNSRVIFDGTAGIVVRSFDVGNESAGLVQGDSITVSGILDEYNNLLQISESPIIITLHKQDAGLPSPQLIDISEVGEEYESELVKIKGVRFVEPATFQGGGSAGNFPVSDGNTQIVLRIGSSSHPLVGESTPAGEVDIIGIVGQFSNDYQISPRTADDLIVGITTSISYTAEKGIKLYPNPVNTELNLYFEGTNITSFSYSIIDNTGQTIKLGKGNRTSSIELPFLHKGIYYLRINTGETIQTNKFIKL